jgi:hypothetical protein
MGNLFIPKRIRVGFQNRQDTFTGKLAYVIYYDEKNKIRKEASWKSWCDAKIPFVEFDNTPQPNFVFNKGVQRYGYHWGSGRSMVRIYDPRNFEFEITVPNTLGILMHSDVSKRDIVEQCVYAWEGSELVLLPVNSEEYQESIAYTAKQDMKISAKDLKKGHTYSQRKSDTNLVYIGYFEYWENGGYRNAYAQTGKGKRHVFMEDNEDKKFVIPSVGTLAADITSDCHADYSQFIDNFFNSLNGAKVDSIEFKAGFGNDTMFVKPLKNGNYIVLNTNEYEYNRDQGFCFDENLIRDAKANRKYNINFPSGYERSIGLIPAFKVSTKHGSGTFSESNALVNYNYIKTGNSYYDLPRLSSVVGTPEFDELRAYFVSQNYDLTKITKTQIKEAAKAIGYGRIYAVLTSGGKVDITKRDNNYG